VLGIYPEGTRRRGLPLPFRSGAAWIALASGTPLVPAGIVGTGGIFSSKGAVPRRVRVEIAFGKPIRVARGADPKRRLDQASDRPASV